MQESEMWGRLHIADVQKVYTYVPKLSVLLILPQLYEPMTNVKGV